MEELEGSARGVSLRAAACMLAGDARDPVSGERVRRAVDAQLRRAGVAAQDADDVRTDVVLALLSAPAADLPLPLELVCARAAVIARNKAVDLGRRSARAADRVRRRPARAASARGRARDRSPTGSTRSRRRRTGGGCSADLARALEGLDAPQRAAIARARRAAARRAPPGFRARRTTARSPMLRHVCAAICAAASPVSAALGDLARALHARSSRTSRRAHAAAAGATAAVAVGAALALSVPTGGDAPTQVPAPSPSQASGGRVHPSSRRAARRPRPAPARDRRRPRSPAPPRPAGAGRGRRCRARRRAPTTRPHTTADRSETSHALLTALLALVLLAARAPGARARRHVRRARSATARP